MLTICLKWLAIKAKIHLTSIGIIISLQLAIVIKVRNKMQTYNKQISTSNRSPNKRQFLQIIETDQVKKWNKLHYLFQILHTEIDTSVSAACSILIDHKCLPNYLAITRAYHYVKFSYEGSIRDLPLDYIPELQSEATLFTALFI